ncbi:MAG: hypothetical protein PHS57_04000 [Alphaproteobacteria bacterium]|nr:hypothetical protein [Alphaproteobacteria bacterium]
MKQGQERLKPSLNEWASAADSLAMRLTECVHVYKHNTDVFMSEIERQQKTEQVIKLLQKLHSLLDETDAPEVVVARTEARDEKIVKEFNLLFVDALKALPGLSSDMQKLLRSPWMKEFTSKIAECLFFGDNEEEKGIGSGYPEHGRLPAVLADLLDREDMGDVRLPRTSDGETPSRHDIEGSLRWVQQNSAFLRTAGRVD